MLPGSLSFEVFPASRKWSSSIEIFEACLTQEVSNQYGLGWNNDLQIRHCSLKSCFSFLLPKVEDQLTFSETI